METKSDRKDVVLNSTKTVPILTFSKNLVVSLITAVRSFLTEYRL